MGMGHPISLPSENQAADRATPPAFATRQLVSASVVAGSFVVCVIAHHMTPHTPANHVLHHIHYLMFMFPITLAAVWFGVWPGLVVAVLAALAYGPYAFSEVTNGNPAGFLEGVMEVGLYMGVALVLGLLADRERRQRRRLEQANAALEARTAQLLAAERHLAQTERLSALGRLAATIAHEVRNPLGSIKGSAEILADEFGPDHPKRKFLDIVVNEANRLNAVLENFLDFARQPSLELTPVQPAKLLQDVATLVEPQCRRAGIRLVTLPSAATAALTGDERQLQQAVLNLVLNAIEAMPDGGDITLRCTRRHVDGAPAVALTIDDSGTGLPPGDPEGLFEPFLTTKTHGTGLGLPGVRKVVEAHGGTVFLEARPDGRTGTRACIVLPLRREDAPREVTHGGR